MELDLQAMLSALPNFAFAAVSISILWRIVVRLLDTIDSQNREIVSCYQQRSKQQDDGLST